MTLTRKIGSLRYFYSASYFFSAILVIVSAIVPHALSKGIILRRIFTTASYCMVLRMTLTRQLPGSIQMWYDTLALVKKIEVGSQKGDIIIIRNSICKKYTVYDILILSLFCFLQDFLTKEEYRVLEYNLTTTELEMVNVSASWDEVCSSVCLSLNIYTKYCRFRVCVKQNSQYETVCLVNFQTFLDDITRRALKTNIPFLYQKGVVAHKSRRKYRLLGSFDNRLKSHWFLVPCQL